MKTSVAIVQARMSSSRLPGKALLQLGGVTAIEHLVNRLNSVEQIGQVVVATTTDESDDVLADVLALLGVDVFRGSSEDVLDRIACAVRDIECSHVVKVTADCPLLDPNLVSQVIDIAYEGGFDFVSNGILRSFPDGMDCAVVRKPALLRSAQDAKEDLEREHTSLHIRRNPQLYSQFNVFAPDDLFWPDLGLTLDTKEDLAVLDVMARHFDADGFPSCGQMIDFMRNHPELREVNARVPRKGDT